MRIPRAGLVEFFLDIMNGMWCISKRGLFGKVWNDLIGKSAISSVEFQIS